MDSLVIKFTKLTILRFSIISACVFLMSCNKETLVEGRISNQIKGTIDVAITTAQFNQPFSAISRSISIEGVSLTFTTSFGKIRNPSGDSSAIFSLACSSISTGNINIFLRALNSGNADFLRAGSTIPITFPVTTPLASVGFSKSRQQTTWSSSSGKYYVALNFLNSQRESIYGWISVEVSNTQARYSEYLFQSINPPVIP